MKIAVFDCEIKQSPVNRARTGSGSWTDYARMGISVAVVQDNWTIAGQWRPRFYVEAEVCQLVAHLRQAEIVVSYNGKAFDDPLVSHFFGGPVSWSSHVDLCELIHLATGKRRSLQDVAAATLAASKSEQASFAPKLFQDGDYGRLYTYCNDDVRLTRDLYLFAGQIGGVFVPGSPDRRFVPVSIPGGFAIETTTKEQRASAPRHKMKLAWRKDPATDSQIYRIRRMLRMEDWQPPDGFEKGPACDMIDQLTEEKQNENS